MKRAFVLLVLAACGSDSPTPWLEDAHVLVDGYDEFNTDCRSGLCDHDENTDLVIYGGATYLVHRTAISQVLGPNSSLRVSRSDDHGATWNLLAVIPAPVDRDLRDPSFYVDATGALAIKAITRLPVTSDRDSNVDSITVRTTSPDAGATWSPFAPIGPPTWSFWRVKTDSDGMLYSVAYQDGDQRVALFASADGVTWTQGPTVFDSPADTPSETELLFDEAGVTALVRVDGTDAELLGSQGRLRTIACTAPRPYTSFDCSRVIDGVRLDGPVAFDHGGRRFVIARKHYLEVANRKRTALYELVGDGVVEHGEFPSAGDTSYAGIAPIAGDRFVVTYYSSNVKDDGPWARAMLGPTDIWQATIDLAKL